MPEKRKKTGFRGPGPDVGKATRWKPGQSGNPGGRPKKTPLADACRELLNMPVPKDKSGRSYAEAISEKLARKALAGNISAVREIADRAEGKARQAMELSGPGSGPLEIQNMTDEELNKRLEQLRAKEIENMRDEELDKQIEELRAKRKERRE
jgi:ribosomal protein L29